MRQRHKVRQRCRYIKKKNLEGILHECACWWEQECFKLQSCRILNPADGDSVSLFCGNLWEQHAARAAASHCCSGGVNAEPNTAPGDPQQPSPADCSLLSLPSPLPPPLPPPPSPPPPLPPPPPHPPHFPLLSMLHSSEGFEKKEEDQTGGQNNTGEILRLRRSQTWNTSAWLSAASPSSCEDTPHMCSNVFWTQTHWKVGLMQRKF